MTIQGRVWLKTQVAALPGYRFDIVIEIVSKNYKLQQFRSGLDTSTSWPDVQLSLISVTPGVDAGLVYRRWSYDYLYAGGEDDDDDVTADTENWTSGSQ